MPTIHASAAVVLGAAGALAAVAMAAAGPAETPSGDAWYLFTSFRGNGEDGLHLAVSRDGYVWTPLGDDEPYLRPQVGPKPLMRDPCLARGPDGTFHLVWTTGWGTPPVIGYASSKDLVRWSPQTGVPVMEDAPGAKNAWAPELFYDEPKGRWLVFWSSTVPGRFPETQGSGDGDLNHRVYCKTTKDFRAFSPTKLFYDGGFNVIDATILKDGGTHYLIVKDETKAPVRKHLRLATGPSAEGPWSAASEPFTRAWVEGPSALRIGPDVLVYFDHYAQPHHYGAVRTRDFKTWEDVSGQMKFPPDHRHGTVLKVPREVVDGLRGGPASDGGK